MPRRMVDFLGALSCPGGERRWKGDLHWQRGSALGVGKGPTFSSPTKLQRGGKGGEGGLDSTSYAAHATRCEAARLLTEPYRWLQHEGLPCLVMLSCVSRMVLGSVGQVRESGVTVWSQDALLTLWVLVCARSYEHVMTLRPGVACQYGAVAANCTS